MLWTNAFIARRLRKGRKNTPGFNFDLLLLTTTGRKSGLERTSPLGWVSDGNGGWLIAASANGAAGNPAWYHNLAAAPDKARIEVDGATIPVSAEQLHGGPRCRARCCLAGAHGGRATLRQVRRADRPGDPGYPPDSPLQLVRRPVLRKRGFDGGAQDLPPRPVAFAVTGPWP